MKVWLWLLLGGAVYAQTATVEGKVVNAVAGGAVRKAAVTARRGEAVFTVETGSGGAFRIEGLSPGAYSIAAERGGYVSKRPLEITLEPGSHLTGVSLPLTPAAVISGRTLDPDGDPVSHMSVAAMQYSYAGGKKTLVRVRASISDDRGQYRIFDLPPGRYYLQASLAGSTQAAPLLAYYPAASAASGAVPVDAAGGAELQSVDIRLRPLALYTVRARIANGLDPARLVGPGRVPTPTFVPQIHRRGGEAGSRPVLFATSSRNNVYEIPNVPPGEYSFTAQQPDPDDAERRLYARHIFEVVDADVEFAATLAPVVEVTMRLQGGGKAGARLEPIDPIAFAMPRTTLHPDGRLVFQNVARDRYYLRVSAPEGSYLKSIRFGERALESQLLDLTGPVAPVVVRVAEDGGAVAGLVLDGRGEPAERANIAIEPVVPGWPDHQKVAISDSHGNFHIPDVAPGDYRIFAWEEGGLDETRAVSLRVSADREARVTLHSR